MFSTFNANEKKTEDNLFKKNCRKQKGEKKLQLWTRKKKIILIFTIRHVTWDHNKFQRKKNTFMYTNKKKVHLYKQINKKKKKKMEKDQY